MTCNTIEILLATRRDLPPEQERAVQTHLRTCPQCAAVWEREQRTTQLLQSLPAAHTYPAPLVTQQIRARLTRSPRRRTPHFVIAAVVALCCLILVGAVAAQAYPQQVQQMAVRLGLATDLAQDNVYIVSLVTGDDHLQTIGSRTTVIDSTTGTVRYTIDGSSDAVVSPDGTRLYAVVGNNDGLLSQAQERVVAFDVRTRQELWRSELVTNRVVYILGRGPSTLAMSPNGRWLYIHSYDSSNANASTWLQIMDTNTGVLLPNVIELPSFAACSAPRFATPPRGNILLITCNQTIRMLNVDTNQYEQFSLPAAIVDLVVSPDGQTLYALSSDLNVFVVDLDRRRVTQQADLKQGNTSFTLEPGLLVLSKDGATLVAGQLIKSNEAETRMSELRAFDTRTWQERGRVQYNAGLRPHTLAVSAGGTRVHVVAEQWDDGGAGSADTVLEFNMFSKKIISERKRAAEEILRLFVGP